MKKPALIMQALIQFFSHLGVCYGIKTIGPAHAVTDKRETRITVANAAIKFFIDLSFQVSDIQYNHNSHEYQLNNMFIPK